MISGRILQNLAISITLACLLFFAAIRNVLFPIVGIRPWAVDYSPIEATALLALILTSSVILFVCVFLSDRISEGRVKTEVRLLFLLISCAMFGALSFQIVNWFLPLEEPFVSYLLPITILATCLLTSIRAEKKIEAAQNRMRGILTVLSPAAALLLFQCVSISISSEPENEIVSIVSDTRSQNRIVWIIFDELDQASLENRPPGIDLPAFENLMSGSFVAKNAIPPAQETMDSIPSLLYGRIFHPKKSGILEVWTGFTEKARSDYFRTREENLVTDLRALRMNSGVVGWYVPYERMFGPENTYGEWSWFRTQNCKSFNECCSQVWDRAVRDLPLGNPLSITSLLRYGSDKARLDAGSQRQRNRFLMGHVKRLLDNASYDFRLLHLSVPHSPYTSTDVASSDPGYFDSLEVADRDLADIINQIASGEHAETTILIVTSDHWWRQKTPSDFSYLNGERAVAAAEDIRVPFIVQFPGNTEPLNFEPQFNTVLTRSVINAIAKGEVKTIHDLKTFLESSIAKDPQTAAFKAEWTAKEF